MNHCCLLRLLLLRHCFLTLARLDAHSASESQRRHSDFLVRSVFCIILVSLLKLFSFPCESSFHATPQTVSMLASVLQKWRYLRLVACERLKWACLRRIQCLLYAIRFRWHYGRLPRLCIDISFVQHWLFSIEYHTVIWLSILSS